MRVGVGAVVLAACLATSGAQAAVPSLPATATDDERQAWVGEHIGLGTGVVSVSDVDSAQMFDPNQFEKLADGRLVGWFRAEYFRPQRSGDITFRSSRKKVEIDCAASRLRMLATETYPQNNLGGALSSGTVSGEWLGPLSEETPSGQELAHACSYADLVGSADWARAVPPIPDATPEARTAWRLRYLEAGDDAYLTDEGGTPVFYAPKDLEVLPNGHVRAWKRTELTAPMVLGLTALRSVRTQLEIDCDRNRYRSLDLIVFPGSNMLGKAYADFTDDGAPWTASEPGALQTATLRALCVLAKAPQTPPAEALRQPEIPPPVSMNEAEARAWVTRYINTNGYIMSSMDDEGVAMYDTASLEALPRDHVLATVRRELYALISDGGRSMLMRMEFDCRGVRSRYLGIATYPQSNLEGEPREDGDLGWGRRLPEKSNGALLIGEICSQRSLFEGEADRGAAFIPSPVSTKEEDLVEWAKAHVDMEGYSYGGHTEDALGLYSDVQAERTAQGFLRVWTRMEFYEPRREGGQLVRSMRLLSEYDCAQGRSRTLATELYPGANLKGRPQQSRPAEAAWAFYEPATLESALANRLCGLTVEADKAARDKMEDMLSTPRLPAPGQRTPL